MSSREPEVSVRLHSPLSSLLLYWQKLVNDRPASDLKRQSLKGYLFVVANRHARRSFDGFCRDELVRVARKLLNAVDQGGAMDCFGRILWHRSRRPLLLKVANVNQSYGARLAGSRRVNGERQL